MNANISAKTTCRSRHLSKRQTNMNVVDILQLNRLHPVCASLLNWNMNTNLFSLLKLISSLTNYELSLRGTFLGLVHTSDRIGSGVGSSTESESEGSEEFLFLPIPGTFPSLPIQRGIGSGSGIISQSKQTHYQSLLNLEQEKKMAALEEKLAEALIMRQLFPVHYDNSCKNNNRKE